MMRPFSLLLCSVFSLLMLLVPGASADLSAQMHERPSNSLEAINRRKAASHNDNKRLSDEDNALRTVFEYGECIADRYENRVRPLMTVSMWTFRGKDERSFIQRRCFSSGLMTLPLQTAVASVHRAFFIEDFEERRMVFAPESVDFTPLSNNPSEQEQIHAVHANFAGCIVRADFENARAFVTELPGSVASNDALMALVPQFEPCATEQVASQMSKTILFAFLAEALHREALAGLKYGEQSEAAE
ncbi:hypothetical protein ACFCW2_11885 [Qipengyuania sp. DSG2-2]|uniref:hypothetical protein n=1 Tax=Qipengyuania sp. DGS2-2 TaxID=3349631 RepID=UPI0036D40EC6